MIFTFTTNRLILTTLNKNDHEFIRQLVNSEGWIQFIGDRNVHNKEDAIAYINKINGQPNYHYYVVRLKESEEQIGIVTFIKRDYLDHFDIGFAFLPHYNGRGYAYEATNEFLLIIKSMPEHSVILATTKSENIKSIKLLEKLGLRFKKQMEVGADLLHIYST